MFIQPADSEEITSIIYSMNINKASRPFNIPTKILILLKEDISKQLADLFNLSLFYQILKKYLKNLYLKEPITFLFENCIIYDLQLGFTQKIYTFHGLINFTENVNQALNESM